MTAHCNKNASLWLALISLATIFLGGTVLHAQVNPPPFEETIELDVVFVHINNASSIGPSGQDLIGRPGVQEIFNQANIKINWLPPEHIWSDELAFLNDSKFSNIESYPEVKDVLKKYNGGVIKYFIVEQFICDGLGSCGKAFVGYPVAASPAGSGFSYKHHAHEIGHCLGLRHVSDINNLMTSGSSNGLGILTPTQVQKVREFAYYYACVREDQELVRTATFVGIRQNLGSSYQGARFVKFKGLVPGRNYMILISRDMSNWFNFGGIDVVNSETHEFSIILDTPSLDHFFRVELRPPSRPSPQ